MKAYFFLAAGFAVLLVLKREMRPKIEKELSPLIGEMLVLVTVSAGILSIYFFLEKSSGGMRRWAEAGIFFAWLGAYFLSRLLKKKDGFFLALFGLTVFLLKEPLLFSLAAKTTALAGLAAGVLIFEILALGLRQRLLFSSPSESFSGLPVFLIASALLAMALTGFLAVF